MTINDMKTILINHLNGTGHKARAVTREVVNQIIRGEGEELITCSEVLACQIGGTTVFVSDAGLLSPDRVVFVDLKSRKSFLQDIEIAA